MATSPSCPASLAPGRTGSLSFGVWSTLSHGNAVYSRKHFSFTFTSALEAQIRFPFCCEGAVDLAPCRPARCLSGALGLAFLGSAVPQRAAEAHTMRPLMVIFNLNLCCLYLALSFRSLSLSVSLALSLSLLLCLSLSIFLPLWFKLLFCRSELEAKESQLSQYQATARRTKLLSYGNWLAASQRLQEHRLGP